MPSAFADRYGDYEDVSTSYAVLAATDYTTATAKIAARTNYTIFVRKITLAVTTDNAATQTFQDSAGTPVLIAKSKASPGLGPITWDFGERGVGLTESTSLDHLMSATGLAGHVYIEAYRKFTASNIAYTAANQ